ncbi:MAG: hypothetical protein IT285_13965 [Bdellovibrionales bacterium]|nr:hypothetical protein [Bdellovibrionales bacterium]
MNDEALGGRYSIRYLIEPLAGSASPPIPYSLEIELPSFTLRPGPAAKSPPDWTKLGHHQCEGCPLKEKEHPHCPVAVNISELAERFAAAASYGRVRVTVSTPERDYRKETSLQEALFSVFGIIMATSRCPMMDFLRPMTRFHLPFATTEETLARSTAFYLLRQYFVKQAGGKPDWDLSGLKAKYEGVERVNLGILDRIREILRQGDADPNALVILNVFAQTAGMEIGDQLGGLKALFAE